MVDDKLPKVDEEYLASLLGLGKWPCPLRNWEERTAARVVTDFMCGNPKPYAAIQNAVTWIMDAYEKGRDAGIREEREEWEQKIHRLFGLKESQQ